MNLYSIVILTCWYGPYPWYFSYFLHSCSYNPSIDFYIITDNEGVIYNQPRNVKIINRELNELMETASQKLCFSVTINHPYKLNDFKPAYGFIFPELIDGYDFWGHSDLDIIYGNIRDFLTNDMLGTYDFISLGMIIQPVAFVCTETMKHLIPILNAAKIIG